MNALWQSPALPAETVADAAQRFVQERFGVERRIVWGQAPGEFRFADGYWCYRIQFNGGHWQVERTEQLTPQTKARVKARREARRDSPDTGAS